jgi:hypothetical protein
MKEHFFNPANCQKAHPKMDISLMKEIIIFFFILAEPNKSGLVLENHRVSRKTLSCFFLFSRNFTLKRTIFNCLDWPIQRFIPEFLILAVVSWTLFTLTGAPSLYRWRQPALSSHRLQTLSCEILRSETADFNQSPIFFNQCYKCYF